MRVAFISHEYPPETGGGGIGAYLDQAANGLAAMGDSVEVFAGGAVNATHRRGDGVVVHRVACDSSPRFGATVVEFFAKVHGEKPFDVVEGNDFDASALGVKDRFPDLPYVCKLHTLRFAVDVLHYRPPSWRGRLGIALGALRRGRPPPSFSSAGLPHTASARAELAAISRADLLAAPSRAIARAVAQWVPGCEERVQVFPYPFMPASASGRNRPRPGRYSKRVPRRPTSRRFLWSVNQAGVGLMWNGARSTDFSG